MASRLRGRANTSVAPASPYFLSPDAAPEPTPVEEKRRSTRRDREMDESDSDSDEETDFDDQSRKEDDTESDAQPGDPRLSSVSSKTDASGDGTVAPHVPATHRLEYLLSRYEPSPSIPGLSHISRRAETDELAKLILATDERFARLKGIVPRWHIKFLKHFPDHVDSLVTLLPPHEAHAEHDKVFRGKIYASASHFFFYGKFFKRAIRITVPWQDVLHLDKRTRTVHNRGMKIITIGSRFFFRMVFRRDAFLEAAHGIWQKALQTPALPPNPTMHLNVTTYFAAKDKTTVARTIHDLLPHTHSVNSILSPSAFKEASESRPRSSQESLTRMSESAADTSALSTDDGATPTKPAEVPPASRVTEKGGLRGSLTKAIKDATRTIRQTVPSPLKHGESSPFPRSTEQPVEALLTEPIGRASRSGSSHSLHLHPDMSLPSTCPCPQHHQFLLFDEVLAFKLGHVVQALFKRPGETPGLPADVHPEYQPAYTNLYYAPGAHHVIDVSLKSIVAGGVDLLERFCLTSIRCPTTKSGSREIYTRVFVSGGTQQWDATNVEVQKLLQEESNRLRLYIKQVKDSLNAGQHVSSEPKETVPWQEETKEESMSTSLSSPTRSTDTTSRSGILRRGHSRKTSNHSMFRTIGGTGSRKKAVHYAHSRNVSHAAHDFAHIVSRRQKIRDIYKDALQRISDQAQSGGDAIKAKAERFMQLRQSSPLLYFTAIFFVVLSIDLYITYQLIQQSQRLETWSDRIFDPLHFKRAAEVVTFHDPEPLREVLTTSLHRTADALNHAEHLVRQMDTAAAPFW